MLPLSSPSSNSRQKYDVFLSFRGEDTRKNFTDHLYAALIRSGIVTFKDDPTLEAGEEIAPELIKAIQESWCSIIVFSKTYAFSGWCLDEITQIVEQRNKRGHKIFPIFYDVDPSDLRKQTGKIEEVFAKHEERHKENKDKVKMWRNALIEVAYIKGWHLSNRNESEFIRDIVKNISVKLCQTYSYIPNELIGISSRLKELYSKINFAEDDVRVIGICGMGGIGKTTLAKVVYTQMSPHFEGKSFIANVREVSEEYELVSLQKQLLSQILLEEGFNLFDVHEGNAIISHRLSHKKVLVVIDDANNLQHIKCLVGRRDWFGLGSKIIITTRDEHLLRSYRVDDVYKIATLDGNEALRLFNLKAFGNDTMQENAFVELSKQVVKYAGGLPLALEVLGSFFCGRDASQWRSAIERLKRDSNKEIHDRLKVSFDGLEETEKNIFLDIACFFNGEEKDFVLNLLDGCDFFSNIGIDVLTKKSLIKVDEGNKLWMHSLLQEMGRKIVRQKSPNEPRKRSRLWEEMDVNHVLTKNTATEAIEGMVIDSKREQNKTCTFCVDAFLKMKRLRLLRVFYLTSSQNLKYLSCEIRLLEWHGYPFKSLPSSFQLDNLVALILPYSSIKHIWNGSKSLYKLKLINLKGSQNLIRTPEFTMAPNLESLIFEGCSRIVDVHPSIGVLSNLVLLNMKDCSNLVSLPSRIDGCKHLKALNLSGCSKLKILPDNLHHVEFLEELDLSETAIRKPPSIFQFKKLKVLSFKGCKGSPSKLRPNFASLFKVLQRGSIDSVALMLPPLSSFSSLTELNLSDCNLEERAIPSDICCLSSLKVLGLSGNNFIYLPATLSGLPNLRCLDLSDCRKLKSLSDELLSSLEYVLVDNCASLEVVGHPTTTSSALYWTFVGNVNSCNLIKKNNVLIGQKKGIKVFVNARVIFDVLMLGSVIPNWFHHQRDESSIMLPLPRNIQNDSKWIGIAFCCIFVTAFKDYDAWEKGEEIICKATIHSGKNSRRVNNSGYTFGKIYRLPLVIRDHLWLRYWSRGSIYPTFLHDKCDNLLSSNLEHEESGGIFESRILCDVSYKVKRCGIRLVYEKDLEVLEEIKKQCSSATSAANFDNNIYEEEAGPSEIIFLFDIAEETPQEKRLRKTINSVGGDIMNSWGWDVNINSDRIG